MNGNKIKLNRRDFLKFLGVSASGGGLAACDLPSTVTLPEGEEDIVSYVAPEEYVIPGIGVWYASTCLQCAAACGIHGRVREGRVLKIEGNPHSVSNEGKTCMMGQAAVQNHYNPNRLRNPMLRKNGVLVDVSWKEADTVLAKQLGAKAKLAPNSVAWLTGTVSGHQAILIQNQLDSVASNRHYRHEVIGARVWQTVANDLLGDFNPLLEIAAARSILSFGADFLGTWQEPVHFAVEYAKFRRGDRGVLMVAEPKMSLTGANADLWLAVKPGTEGVLALAIANRLMTLGAQAPLPETIQAKIKQYIPAKASPICGVTEKRIKQIAKTLFDRSPSVVLAGAPVEGQINGYQATAAIMLLNILLGNIGKTVIPRTAHPLPRMAPRPGGTKDLADFIAAAKKGEIKVALIHGSNPVYTSPAGLNIKTALEKIKFKIQLAVSRDETTAAVDLVLPMYSALEDWGTHVAEYQGKQPVISMQQPLMEPLHPQTRGFGDTLIGILKSRQVPQAMKFKDYYGYLRNAVANFPAPIKAGVANEEAFWTQTLKKGFIAVKQQPVKVVPRLSTVTLDGIETKNNGMGLTLIPSPRMSLWDGRHANIPWLQEAPDPINKVVWDSWAEIHPTTASDLGIKHGDEVEIRTAHSSIRVKAFIFKGIHPNAVSVPMGQGHDGNFGEFAKGIGANPLQLLNPDIVERQTGEWALYGQSVKISRIGKGKIVRMGGVDTQRGRKISNVISASQYRRTEGGQS